jgi:hypothetical protein
LEKESVASLKPRAKVGSLLNLVILRNRLSNQVEVVSGAVDVALISRSEGFRWVKSKKPE